MPRVARIRAIAGASSPTSGVTAPPAHADDRAPRGAPEHPEMARPRTTDPQRTPRARCRASGQGRDVVADYAVNVFNAHTAAELFRLGARRIVASVELTTDELSQLVAPWDGERFDVFLYGRPEGMTIEHCVLSAAFDRETTTCRDLCVQKHPNVELTDPTGYTFPVATDSACRNRLLHSRPIDGAEFLPSLWRAGIRGYHWCSTCRETTSARSCALSRRADALASGARPTSTRSARVGGRRVHARPFRPRGLMDRAARCRWRRTRRPLPHSERMTTLPHTLDDARAALREHFGVSGVSARAGGRRRVGARRARIRSSSCPPAAESRSATRCRR